MPTDAGVCPNCLAANAESLYEVREVPVHSVLLMRSRDEAMGYPRGDVSLKFCPRCGFLYNGSFDPSVHEYSTRCEESQGFSGTFNAFARRLASQVVEQYDVRGKTVLEIGCGKGEFLELLCRLGDNRGIGIDPAFIPERMQPGNNSRLQFIQDLYSEKYAHLEADVVCCRHTLEHIAPTYEFLSLLRRTIGQRDETLVFFELPEAMRVLKEGAFWDIYYEHCSYFTPGSLARLFRSTGFDILDLELDYDDQYILIAARPSDGSAAKFGGDGKFALEDDLDEIRAAAAAFPEVCRQAQDGWRTMLREAAAKGQRTAIWGGGSKGVAFLTTLGIRQEVCCVVDINPHKQGKFMPGTGHAVVSPEQLVDQRPDHLIVMNPVYCEEIQAELDRLRIKARLCAVGKTFAPGSVE